jgi:hypothetical protein
MDEITRRDEAQYAFLVKNLVIEYKDGINHNLWLLAQTLKEMRDKKLYRALDCGTFSEFIAQPEIGLKKSAVYALIKRYEIYSEHLQIPENRLLSIDHSKLDIIAPVVCSDPEKWISNAAELSARDLINEVRIAQGREEMSPIPPSSTVSAPAPGMSYEEYVRRQPCCACGASECDASDYAHFPRTKAAGGTFGIPLCRKCHEDFDGAKDPAEWVWENRFGWGRYLEQLVIHTFGKP